MVVLFDNSSKCCGCTACENICPTRAIEMENDNEGFLYPVIDEKRCISCRLCKKVCVFQNGYDYSEQLSTSDIYAVKNKNDNVRRKSSSGGVFTSFSDYILGLNGAIYGAILDEDIKVRHKRATDQEIRNNMRGSKYVQSDLGNMFLSVKNDLLADKNVIFSGTPCQCAGLKSFLHESKCDDSKLLTIDFICHGVPSPEIFKEYLKFSETKKNSKIVNYSFRSKVDGWNHTEVAYYENGKADSNSRLIKSYKQLFYSNVCLRPSCHDCQYTNVQRVSDITIADYWGIDKLHPQFFDELGVSAIMINSKKGKLLFNNLKEDFNIIETSIESLKLYQHNLKLPSSPSRSRAQFWKDYNNLKFEDVLKRYTTYGNKRYIMMKIIKVIKQLGLFETILKFRDGITKDTSL